uniref:Peptidase A1 domain-containing protein n=1 Tax=Aegilops tauschii subsp. strangulata TaxID=200361 RepID=A0A453DFZ1_AEGTS
RRFGFVTVVTAVPLHRPSQLHHGCGHVTILILVAAPRWPPLAGAAAPRRRLRQDVPINAARGARPRGKGCRAGRVPPGSPLADDDDDGGGVGGGVRHLRGQRRVLRPRRRGVAAHGAVPGRGLRERRHLGAVPPLRRVLPAGRPSLRPGRVSVLRHRAVRLRRLPDATRRVIRLRRLRSVPVPGVVRRRVVHPGRTRDGDAHVRGQHAGAGRRNRLRPPQPRPLRRGGRPARPRLGPHVARRAAWRRGRRCLQLLPRQPRRRRRRRVARARPGRRHAGGRRDGLFDLTEDGGGGVVMDTGTAVTRLPADAYAALRDAFADAVGGGLPRAPGVSLLDTCYDLSGYASVRVPTVALYFGRDGAALTLPARNLLVEMGGGVYCLAFAASASGLSILGNIQQQGIQITVDSATGYVGFGPATC